jgi:hypothetical protein
MKRLLIILVAVLLLCGGGFGGIYLFMPGLLGKKLPAPAEVPPPPPTISGPVKPTLVKMPTIDVPLMLDGEPNRQIHFNFTLVVAPESLSAAQEALPRLRNSIIQFTYDAFPRQYAEQGRMDLPRLKASLEQIARRVLGAPAVKDVLLQSYFEI